MSSNYPMGISDNTYNTPWNDIDVEFSATLDVKISDYIVASENSSREYVIELINDKINSIKEEIKNKLGTDTVVDINIVNYNIA